MKSCDDKMPWNRPPFGCEGLRAIEARRIGERWARDTVERIRKVLDRKDRKRKP